MESPLVERNEDQPGAIGQVSMTGRLPSYRPTPWVQVNRVLDIIDKLTNGRAGLCQKFFSFAFIGGCTSLVNLGIYALLFYKITLPIPFVLRDSVAYVIAYETSIIANFIPNDYFTFRHMPGHERSWVMRGLRFNLTCVGGALLTYLIHLVLIAVHVPSILALALAIIIVLFYNFSVHHIFTYRKVKRATPLGK